MCRGKGGGSRRELLNRGMQIANARADFVDRAILVMAGRWRQERLEFCREAHRVRLPAHHDEPGGVER